MAAMALGTSLFLSSCGDLGEPTRPGLLPGPMVVTSTSGATFVVAYESNPSAGSVSATIGSSGGILVLGKHAVFVSADAVGAPTRFTMARDLEHPLRVKLTAGQAAENDIGSAGFAAPVYVSLSYVNAAAQPSNAEAVRVVFFRPDGLVEEMPSVVYSSENRVTARVSHFSLYGIAWP